MACIKTTLEILNKLCKLWKNLQTQTSLFQNFQILQKLTLVLLPQNPVMIYGKLLAWKIMNKNDFLKIKIKTKNPKKKIT